MDIYNAWVVQARCQVIRLPEDAVQPRTLKQIQMPHDVGILQRSSF